MTLDYTTKPQCWKHYGAGTETDMQGLPCWSRGEDSTAGSMGSTHGQGTEIPHAAQPRNKRGHSKNRHTDQCNRTERSEINLCQVIYHKEGKNIQWRKESLFSKWCRDNWTAPCKRMKL